jgi:hypothetical protein
MWGKGQLWRFLEQSIVAEEVVRRLGIEAAINI